MEPSWTRVLVPVISVLALAGCFRAGFGEPVHDTAVGDAHHTDGIALGAIVVSSLATTWATPNTIRWQWKTEGQASSFGSYELVVGPDEAEVLSRGPAARVWTAKDNPELGQFTLPGTGANDPVLSTVTDQHQPDTTYYAQLVAVDAAGNRSTSSVISGRTAGASQNEVVIFSEQNTAGYSIPASFTYTQDASQAHAGSRYYRYISSCAGGASACFENLRRQGFSIALDGIDAGDLATSAFYEVAVACEGAPSYWSQARLMFGTSGNTSLWINGGWTLRCDDTYRLLQIPLRSFTSSDKELPHSELARKLYEFTVGGRWSNGATVRVDEVRIRW